jgi:hypothetical protein
MNLKIRTAGLLMVKFDTVAGLWWEWSKISHRYGMDLENTYGRDTIPRILAGPVILHGITPSVF